MTPPLTAEAHAGSVEAARFVYPPLL